MLFYINFWKLYGSGGGHLYHGIGINKNLIVNINLNKLVLIDNKARCDSNISGSLFQKLNYDKIRKIENMKVIKEIKARRFD